MVGDWKYWVKNVCVVFVLGGFVGVGVFVVQVVDVVNVYNWGNLIGKVMIVNFEKVIGIKVVYQEFDLNEMLQVKLLLGMLGYDVVVLFDIFWVWQLQVGIYCKID